MSFIKADTFTKFPDIRTFKYELFMNHKIPNKNVVLLTVSDFNRRMMSKFKSY